MIQGVIRSSSDTFCLLDRGLEVEKVIGRQQFLKERVTIFLHGSLSTCVNLGLDFLVTFTSFHSSLVTSAKRLVDIKNLKCHDNQSNAITKKVSMVI